MHATGFVYFTFVSFFCVLVPYFQHVFHFFEQPLMNSTKPISAPFILALAGLFASVLLGPSSLHAQSSTGNQSVFSFLKLPATARAAALGANHVSLQEANGLLFLSNPAYLNEDSHARLDFSYLNHLSDINMAAGGGAYHSERAGTFAIGLRVVNYGDMRRLGEDGRDEGNFSANDMAFTAGYARPLLENLRVGGAAHLIYSGYGNFSSSALAFNLGIYYFYEALDLHIGGVVEHLGRQLSTFNNRHESMPVDVRLGLSRRLNHVPLRLHLTFHNLHVWDMENAQDEGSSPDFSTNLMRHAALGGELLLSENITFRLGYDHNQNQDLKVNTRLDTAGLSYGLGIDYRAFTFDFSRTSFSDLGMLTRIGVQTRL